MLKKFLSSSLSALMLTSCIGGSVKALPENHIQSLVATVKSGGFYPYWNSPNKFERNLFNKTCFISHFTKDKNNMKLGEELIRKLFKAELLGTYKNTYTQLLNQYNENVPVRNALEEINGFLERSEGVTIEFGKTMFLYEKFPMLNVEKNDPEFLDSLKNMPIKLQKAVLRLESLRSLYYLIHNPERLLNKDIQNLPSFYPIFRPWIDDKGLVTQQGYHRLLSDLFMICSCKNPDSTISLSLVDRKKSDGVCIKFDPNKLFSNDEGEEFSKLIDQIDDLFISHNI